MAERARIPYGSGEWQFGELWSPPDPLTASTRVGTPVIGSSRVTFADVLPPAKLVTRLSAPSRLDRARRAAMVGSSPKRATSSATFDSL